MFLRHGDGFNAVAGRIHEQTGIFELSLDDFQVGRLVVD